MAKKIAKKKGKFWYGLKASSRSLLASVATLKNKKSSVKNKQRARKKLLSAAQAINQFQKLLGLPQRKWKGFVGKVIKDAK